jgi:hypothetical protein
LWRKLLPYLDNDDDTQGFLKKKIRNSEILDTAHAIRSSETIKKMTIE